MSGTHGVFQHRSGYFYTILEEDFCEMYKSEGNNEVCRAYITSIIETLTNDKFNTTGNERDIWVFMSLPEMARRMRHAYSERTIHKEIQGMIKDGFLKKRRAAGKATMEYCLNIQKIREGLSKLPDKQSCKIATSNLADLQDQPCKIARLTLQNCKNDLADLQPRISNRLNIEETKEEGSVADEIEASPFAPVVAPTPTLSSLSSEVIHDVDKLSTEEKKKTARKPKPLKDTVSTEEKARIEAVFECLDSLARETTGMPDFSYSRTKTALECVKVLLQSRTVSPKDLRLVYMEMWNSPKGKDGFSWKENMSVRAICNQYDSKLLAGRSKQVLAPAQESKPKEAVTVGNRHLVSFSSRPRL